MRRIGIEAMIRTGDKPTEYSEIDFCIRSIEERHLLAGGFSEQPNGRYRPDSTAWAVLTLAREGLKTPLIDSGRVSLTASQQQDGRVSFQGAQNVFWPTSLAVLAWHNSQQYREAQSRAIRFLFETSGIHWKKDPDAPTAHDTSIKGWPWTEGTHSFVEPTALALIALEIVGLSGHPRFLEGLNMLMNRQLPRGGWNYGNTMVYGKELLPFIDTTGIALTALAGHVAKEDVKSSILFLRAHVERCRTPLSLGYALFGLGGWGEFPFEGNEWIEQALKRQERYGAYGTSLLSVLGLASLCQGDIRKCVLQP
jgi:hypothetical protein